MPEILQVLDDNMQPLPFAYAGHASEYTTSAPLTDSCGSLVISNFPIPNCCAFYTVSASGSKPFGQAQTKWKGITATKSIQRYSRPQHKQPEFVAVDRFSLESYATHVVQRQNKAYIGSMMN